jgi:hypothetical protein
LLCFRVRDASGGSIFAEKMTLVILGRPVGFCLGGG